MDKIKAIKAINPNAVIHIKGKDLDTCTIEWLEGTSPISKADIQTKMNELQVEYDALEWKRNRQDEYPTIQECVHAILDDDLENLQIKRQAVKEKYPK
jgi:hypothetical protein